MTVPTTKIRIGTRGSKLALWQANYVAQRLAECGRLTEIVMVESQGDVDPRSLESIGGEGVFTQSLQRGLLAGDIDVAVHSLKDLPTKRVPGIELACVPLRHSVRDVLISRHPGGLRELPRGGTIGTSSPRRAAQIQLRRADVQVVSIRGNVDTRLRKLENGEFDALLLAEAGLIRLGLEGRISETFDPTEILPAPGQGALGVEARSTDQECLSSLREIDDAECHLCVTAERQFLHTLQVGCNAPVGAWCRWIVNNRLQIDAVLIGNHGAMRAMRSVEIRPLPTSEPNREIARELGNAVACDLLNKSA